MTKPDKHGYRFGPFQIDPLKRVLLRDGEPVPLTHKVFDTLLVLIESGGRVLEKDDLMKVLWPDTIVEEANLTVNISTLRRVLGERPGEHQYIVTIPGRGYRFVAEVREVVECGTEMVLEEETSARIVIEEEANGSVGVWEKERMGGQRQPLPLLHAHTSIRPYLQPFLGISVLLLGLITAISYFWITGRSKRSESPPAVKSIAVLPFKPLRPEQMDQYLGLGMADTLITKLSNIRQIVVRPTSAVLKYDQPEQDSLAAGRDQRVDAVLEGSIQWVGEKIRVTVRLLSVRDGTPLWAYQCDEKCTDIFAVQDSISEEIARELVQKLTGAEREQLTKRFTENPEAYQAYIRGVYFLNTRSADGLKKAIEYFQQAIEQDPRYALAHAGLSQCYGMSIWFIPLPAKIVMPKAKSAAIKAVQLDDKLPEAHISMASVHNYDWDRLGATREIERAIELNPSSAEAHHGYAYCLIGIGKSDKAVAEIKRALDLDPLSLVLNVDLGEILLYARRYDDAIEALKNAIIMDPNRSNAHYDLAQAYEQKREYDEAVVEYLKAAALGSAVVYGGESEQTLKALKEAYATSGMSGFWRMQLKLAKEKSKRSYVPPALMAGLYACMGENDQAFACLEKAYQDHDPLFVNIAANPGYDRLRSDPRFAELIRRLGLRS